MYLVQSKLVDPCPDLLCHYRVRLDLFFCDCTHTHTVSTEIINF